LGGFGIAAAAAVVAVAQDAEEKGQGLKFEGVLAGRLGALTAVLVLAAAA
jgi:hypothetical protein